ncbi:MAG: ABC transporter permease [Planctomycetota bacterium]
MGLLKGLVANLVLVWLVFTGTFLMIWRLPGDPALVRCGERASPETLANVRREFGLDRSAPERYVRELTRLACLDFGKSLRTRREVSRDLAEGWGATAELALSAFALALVVGVPLGILAAHRRGSLIDLVLSQISLAGVSLPVYVLGLVLILTLGQIPWLSFDGRLGAGIQVPEGRTLLFWGSLACGDWDLALNALSHLVLPALALSTIPTALLMRMTRSALVETLGEDFLRTARAKGAAEIRVVGWHALRAASAPIITAAGLQIGLLLGGAVLTESLFSWPGLGGYLVESLRSRDYPSIQGVIVVGAVMVSLANLVADALASRLDPRLRP